MKQYLSLTKPHNKLATEIADTIKKYYPIGVDVQSNEYQKHLGIIEITTSVGEHMTNYNAYIKPWKSFLANLPKGFKSKIRNHGFANQISYSGELTLEKYCDASMARFKTIIFSVSWLGPFFTIYGIDETVIKDEGIGYGYGAINVITVSPYREFERGFNYLRTEIEKQFVDHKFVPFRTCSLYIRDIQTLYSHSDEVTVHDALFNESLDRYYLPSISKRGDLWYGIESRGDGFAIY